MGHTSVFTFTHKRESIYQLGEDGKVFRKRWDGWVVLTPSPGCEAEKPLEEAGIVL